MSLQEQIDQLKKELLEAQKVRAGHWDKYQLSLITEKILQDFLSKNLEEELVSINTVSFILQCVLKYNSKHKIKVEQAVFLLLNTYCEFLKNKYNLSTQSEAVDLIVNKLSQKKFQQVVLLTVLKNNLVKNRQNKHLKLIENFKSFVDSEKNKIFEKKEFIGNVSAYSYKIFLNQKEKELKETEKIISKKNFILKHKTKLNVAVILDEFSYECFKNEFNAIIVTPKNWREKFDEKQPDLFFCESAWSGTDSIQRPWKGRIYASTNWKNENRSELLEILDYCKKRSIPTIFWNKEDPSHYTDRQHDFVKTAILFDHIFTTAEECVELYKKEYGAKNVDVLPFATAPRMFNPIEKVEREDFIIFAGSWYANHQQRSIDMENILDTLLDTHDLKIVDRYYGSDDELHKYPEKYKDFIYPSVSFSKIPDLYKESKISLNFNTVKNSKTMFARRAFELMSSNTLVVSNSSAGMENLLEELYIDIERDPAVLKKLTEDEIDTIKIKALDYVLQNHTYRNRWNFILEKISYKTINDDHTVTVVCLVNNETEIQIVINKFNLLGKQNYKFLILLNTEIKNENVQDYLIKYAKDNIDLISLSYVIKYLNGFDLMQTTHFYLMDKNVENIKEVVGKLLAHSYYLDDQYVTFDNSYKYKLKHGFIMDNVFTVSKNFTDVIKSANTYVEKDTYCLNEIIEVA